MRESPDFARKFCSCVVTECEDQRIPGKVLLAEGAQIARDPTYKIGDRALLSAFMSAWLKPCMRRKKTSRRQKNPGFRHPTATETPLGLRKFAFQQTVVLE